MEYSVIIPIYNEQGVLKTLYAALKNVMDSLTSSYEIIFINDGSTDRTREILSSLKHDDDKVTVIDIMKNHGQAYAFQKGVNAARGDIIISMDGDYQNDPADIPRLLDKLKTGYNVVCGWRKDRKDRPDIKFLSKIANVSRRVFLGEKIHDVSCALRVYERKTLENLDLGGEMYHMLTAIMLARGYSVGECIVTHHPRTSGNSKYGPLTKIKSVSILLRYIFIRCFTNRLSSPR